MKDNFSYKWIKHSKLFVACLIVSSGPTLAGEVNVYSAAELQAAMQNASPGDEIILYPGDYHAIKGSVYSGHSTAFYYSNRSGNADNKIILRSQSPDNKQLLRGDNVDSGYLLYLTGDHWVVKDLKFSTGQKGIMLEGANYNVLDNIEVSNVGAEAVHFRYFSSNNVLSNCYLHDTGKRDGKAGFGEGVYVGTHDGHTSDKLDNSNNNRIGGCSIGPNVTAEAFDIKSGTSGTIIESNYMNGQGLIGNSASPAADSFIDLKGTNVIVRNNIMDYDGESNFAHGIFTYQEHRSSNIYNNQLTLATSMPTFKLLEEMVHAQNNVRMDGGSRLVDADYQLKKIDDILDQSFETPAQSYNCFDELQNGCGSMPPNDPDPDPEGPSGYSYAANEGEMVNVSGLQDIAYGADGLFYYLLNQSSNVSCDSSTFGDPLPGSDKYCFIKESDPVVPPEDDNCTATQTISWDTRTEVQLDSGNCISFANDLASETMQAWDSDENSSCDFRGEIASTTNPAVSVVVTSNYQSFNSLSGNTFKLVPSNGCQYIKVRAY